MYYLSLKFHVAYIVCVGACVGLFVGVISLFVLPIPVTHAETRLTGGTLYGDIIWNASGSPYILEDKISIPFGSTLTVEPGVIITTDSTADPLPELFVEGTLFMNGTQEKPIIVKNIYDIFINNSTTSMSHVNISTPGSLYLRNSFANISYSSFKGAWQALNIKSGITNISSSSIEGNGYGIYMDNYVPVLMYLFNLIVPQVMAETDQGSVTITNSSFPNGNTVAISNLNPKTGSTFNATGNWWGSIVGPQSSSANSSRIIGSVNYDPWLDHEPDLIEHLKATSASCCSSILFIPGIEGSRLYRDEKGVFGLSTNTLWEPNRNDDVRTLFMNSKGSSTDKTIYSGDPIDSAWGYNVYNSFMKFLNELVAQGDIKSWYGFGYDWRKSIPEVVLGNENKATTTVSLIKSIKDLAQNSKTGKVTIVAHSNGGLVAKYLVKVLADQGMSNVIDSIISVAVPYLGTPQAIGSILHGDDTALAGGLLLKPSVARQLGQNMPSAYSLLPSDNYYSTMKSLGSGSSASSATITFSSTTPKTVNDGTYPKSISSFSDMTAFITDSKNVRMTPIDTDISDPLIGNKNLMASAGNLHSILDTFSWPANIMRWGIVGWNALTTKAISYKTVRHCTSSQYGQACVDNTGHDTTKTNMGDNTVVARSASEGSQTVASVNLQAIDGGKITHSNILESKTTQAIIKNIIGDSSNNSDSSVLLKEAAITKISGVTIGEPDYSKEKTYIAISTHSPIQPHVYDIYGNHVGEIAPPADTEDLYRAYETKIPGSSFEIISNTDTDYSTYVYVPDDGQKYDVVLNGTGFGQFTYDVDRMRDGEIINHAEYADLPVTPFTVASTTIQVLPYSDAENINANNSSTTYSLSEFTNSLKPLVIDVNGDGQSDVTAIHDATLTTDTFEVLKKTCETLDRTSTNKKSMASYCKDISKRIDVIKDKIKKVKLTHIKNSMSKVTQLMKHRDWKKLKDSDRQEVGDMIDNFVGQFE